MSSPLYPLLFDPFLRPMPWGGRRLAEWMSVARSEDRATTAIGEAWLLSDHHLHASRVAAGPLAGWTLRQLMEQRGEQLVGHAAARFPLLIKLLDVCENLSVQVHPDDGDAARWAPAEGGKTEAWFILEAGPEAVIYLGLKPGIDKDTVRRELMRATLPLCLQRYQAQPGQCYFVPAGSIHALGGGLVALEVQQTSDATFRLYDWGRVDAEGNPRPLHVEAALACLKERPPGAGLQHPQKLDEYGERLVTCEFFKINRLAVKKATHVRGPCIFVGLEGKGRVSCGSGQAPVQRGRATLVPASLEECVFEPEGPCVAAQIEIGQ